MQIEVTHMPYNVTMAGKEQLCQYPCHGMVVLGGSHSHTKSDVRINRTCSGRIPILVWHSLGDKLTRTNAQEL